MMIDAELEAWRLQWRAEAEPLPDLKKKVREQNVRTIAGAILTCVCLAISTIAALRQSSRFVSGLATGLWFTSICLGGYTWWVRRGTWKPFGQTALAYAELSHKTAVAKAKILRLSLYLSIATIGVLAAALARDWKNVPVSFVLVMAGLAFEAIALRHYERRKEQEIAETREMLDYLKGN
jgi:hypothetical protein